MASLNRVTIMGNLGADPELRYTASQTPVCTLSVATTDYRTGQDGQRQEQTEWHRVVVWSKQAENCAKYLAKGRSVLVEGRLATRSWEDNKTGQKRYVTEIIASNVQFVGGGRDRPQQPGQGYGEDAGNAGAGGGGGGGYGGARRGNNQQQQPQQGGYDDFGGGGSGFGGPETPGLDDIPF